MVLGSHHQVLHFKYLNIYFFRILCLENLAVLRYFTRLVRSCDIRNRFQIILPVVISHHSLPLKSYLSQLITLNGGAETAYALVRA